MEWWLIPLICSAVALVVAFHKWLIPNRKKKNEFPDDKLSPLTWRDSIRFYLFVSGVIFGLVGLVGFWFHLREPMELKVELLDIVGGVAGMALAVVVIKGIDWLFEGLYPKYEPRYRGRRDC